MKKRVREEALRRLVMLGKAPVCFLFSFSQRCSSEYFSRPWKIGRKNISQDMTRRESLWQSWTTGSLNLTSNGGLLKFKELIANESNYKARLSHGSVA
jgi:hypothetical protein